MYFEGHAEKFEPFFELELVCLLPPAVNSGGGQIRSADLGKHGSRSGKQEVQLTIRETAFLPQNFLSMGGKMQIIELGRW